MFRRFCFVGVLIVVSLSCLTVSFAKEAECVWGSLPTDFEVPEPSDGYVNIVIAVECKTGHVHELSATIAGKHLGSTHGAILVMPISERWAGQQVCFDAELDETWKGLHTCQPVPAPKVIKQTYTPDSTCRQASKLAGRTNAKSTSSGATVFLRLFPNDTEESPDVLGASSEVDLILGPVCIDQTYWYLIQTENGQGWAPEASKGIRYLMPVR